MATFQPQQSSRLGAAQVVAIGAASAASTAFGSQTYQIRVACQLTAGADAHIRVGDGTPTALTTDTLLPTNFIEYLACTPGQKIAVIGGGASVGSLSITEIS